MPEKKIVLYMHAGSGNHGCEAIVNSFCHMLKKKPLVITNSEKEDRKYSLAPPNGDALCELAEERHFSEHKLAHVIYYGWRKLTKDAESFIRYRYRAVFDRPFSRYGESGRRHIGKSQWGKASQTEYPETEYSQTEYSQKEYSQTEYSQTKYSRAKYLRANISLAISIGGDNYCYDVMVKDLMLANRAFHDRGVKTVLLGCSIEPELLIEGNGRETAGTEAGINAVEGRLEESTQSRRTGGDAVREAGRKKMVEDMNLYDLIIARESITYEALKKVVPVEKLRLIPDPAFTLGTKELPLPEGFAEGNTIGLNVSPMIQDSEGKAGITMANYKALIEHIIHTTNMQIALIPHVVWARNDDRKPLNELYETFQSSGRVIKIEDCSCEELKGYIARCRMFIGARTHATIAAYSSLVPTLVVGYSVKAKGIAKDLFGSYENYVLPVQQLQEKEDLIGAFEWLKDYEEDIRGDLRRVMPEYKKRALQAGKEIDILWEKTNMR